MRATPPRIEGRSGCHAGVTCDGIRKALPLFPYLNRQCDMVATVDRMQRQSAADSGAHAGLRLWLYTVAGLILAMVLVGGATRLTDSGLSITEWKPLSR